MTTFVCMNPDCSCFGLDMVVLSGGPSERCGLCDAPRRKGGEFHAHPAGRELHT